MNRIMKPETKNVLIALNKDLVDKIDQERGPVEVSRKRFIEHCIEQYFVNRDTEDLNAAKKAALSDNFKTK